MANCSECGQTFGDKANKAKCQCSCHSPVPSLPRKAFVPRPEYRLDDPWGGVGDLDVRGLLEFGG